MAVKSLPHSAASAGGLPDTLCSIDALSGRLSAVRRAVYGYGLLQQSEREPYKQEGVQKGRRGFGRGRQAVRLFRCDSGRCCCSFESAHSIVADAVQSLRSDLLRRPALILYVSYLVTSEQRGLRVNASR